MDPSLVFAGVAVSLLVQWAKKQFGTSQYTTLAIAAGLAILGAVGFQILSYYELLPSLVQILTTAGAFYTFILQRFETPATPSSDPA